MKTKFLTLCPLLFFLSFQLSAQNTMVTYQGQLLDGGEPYNGLGQFQFALVTSTNLSPRATATATRTAGFIIGYTVTFGGSGYVTPPAVHVNGGGGSGATATATLSGGMVTAINPGSAGSGYTSTPSVTIDAPPANILYTTYWSNDGTSVNGSQPSAAVDVAVSNGLFTVALGDTTQPNMAAIPVSVFNRQNLQLRIWFDDGVHGSAALDPAQSLTPTPYATYANTASNLVNGLIIQQNTNGSPNVIGGSQLNFVSVGISGATIGGGGSPGSPGFNYTNRVTGDYGTVSGGRGNMAGTNATVGGGYFNVATGGYSTVSGGDENFASDVYATVGGGALNLARSNSATVGGGHNNTAQGVYATVSGGLDNFARGAYSIVGGGTFNQTTNNGDVIGGGYNNTVYGAFATIGGGYQNAAYGDYATVGGGGGNDANTYSTVGGGTNNLANGTEAVIGGGNGNTASGYRATVGGGHANTATSDYTTVSGGDGNHATGLYSTVPGGFGNTASSIIAFAGGYSANAAHQGAFVWSDYTAGTFSSTANNQFSVRATGGYRFITSTGGAGAQLSANATSWSVISDRNAKKNFAPVDHNLILDKLAQMPVQQWNYKWEADSDVPNIGPVAQDFKGAFYPGRDDKSISTLEFDGVELAAIQGLNEKVEVRSQRAEDRSRKAEDRIQQLEAGNAELKRQNDSLAKRLEALEKIIQIRN